MTYDAQKEQQPNPVIQGRKTTASYERANFRRFPTKLLKQHQMEQIPYVANMELCEPFQPEPIQTTKGVRQIPREHI